MLATHHSLALKVANGDTYVFLWLAPQEPQLLRVIRRWVDDPRLSLDPDDEALLVDLIRAERHAAQGVLNA